MLNQNQTRMQKTVGTRWAMAIRSPARRPAPAMPSVSIPSTSVRAGDSRSAGLSIWPCRTRRSPSAVTVTAGQLVSSPDIGITRARSPSASPSQSASGMRVSERPVAAGRAAQGGQVRAAAERGAQVVGQRAHVEAGGAVDVERQPIAGEIQQFEVMHRHLHRRRRHRLAAAREPMGAHAADFLGGVGRRRLRNLAAERRQRGLDILARRPSPRPRRPPARPGDRRYPSPRPAAPRPDSASRRSSGSARDACALPSTSGSTPVAIGSSVPV